MLNSRLNDAIMKTRIECVVVWELQLLGIQAGQVYSLDRLQASYQACAQVCTTPSLSWRQCFVGVRGHESVPHLHTDIAPDTLPSLSLPELVAA